MAFIQKIFQTRKNNQGNINWNSSSHCNKGNSEVSDSDSHSSTQNDYIQNPKLEKSQIRLVIYHDSESCRQLIFDSKTVKRVEEPKRRCILRDKVPEGSRFSFGSDPGIYRPSHERTWPKYQFSKPGTDVKMLEEIMFGSVGMAYKGASVKVHFLRDEMVLTKVFIPENPKRESHGSDAEYDSLSLPIHSEPDLSSPRNISTQENQRSNIAQSIPVDVPSPQNVKFDIYDRDSGLASMTSSGSFHHPFPSPGSNTSSCSSYSSLHRRWIRGVSTSIEGCLRKRNSQDNLVAAESNTHVHHGSNRQKHSKVAMGILFGLCDNQKDNDNNQLFQNFFFSHITLFESHLEKLRIGVEKAYYTRKRFVHIVMESLEKFQQDVVDLYTTPRISEPVWLNMMCFASYRYQLCESFMKEFMLLVTKYENKNTRFFMSTLITAVLTHHLAWVPTVTPAGGTPSKTYLTNHSAKWVDMLAKTHPYNPLWAQLGDLYGAIGYPIKLARTIVVGKKADLVKKLLYILTYFIRCSDVQNNELGSLESFMAEVNLDSPSEDKPVITPIEEVSNQTIGQEVMYNSNSSDRMDGSCDTITGECDSRALELQPSEFCVIPKQECAHINHTNSRHIDEVKLSKDMELQTETLTRPKSLSLSKSNGKSDGKGKNNVTKKEDSYRFCESSNSDEGYCSIVQSDVEKDKNDFPCRLSDSEVIENVAVENVQHVSRATCSTPSTSLSPLCSVNKTGKSLLTEKLSKKDMEESKISTAEIRKRFLNEGSHSLFNEYFDDETIEAKTIDDVEEQDRIVNHPLAMSKTGMRKISSSVEDILQASSSFSSNQSEISGHDRRLGSLGHSARPRISSVSRQISVEKSRSTVAAPGRCRSVTPTELSRRRHLSSTGSVDFDNLDPLVHFRELEMPNVFDENSTISIKTSDRNFGRSLMAGYSSKYLSDFVLHGTSESEFWDRLQLDLHMASQHSVLDEPIAEAVCIIADTDKCTVDIVKNGTQSQPVVASQLVCNMLEGVLQLSRLKMSSEFCLMHLEDRLQEIYFKSKMLAEYLKDVKKNDVNMKELKDMLGFENGDVPLLVAIAGTHSPHLSLGVV